MAIQIDNAVFAAAAYSYKDSHIPYSKLDCQAFVERVLHDCGVDYNWRGSNHMWRDALSWKGTIAECMQKFGEVPQGAWLFTVKHDGGEVRRGYHDNEGNACHVGIYCGADLGVMHSTAGGVQLGVWPDPHRWTHVGLCRFIGYPSGADADLINLINTCIARLEELKGRFKNDV